MKIATQFSNTLTLLLLVVNSMSCVQIESGQVGIVPVNSNMSTTTKFDEIAGALTSESNSIWKVSVRRNQFQRKISEYFFLDKKNAWAFGDLLFSTKDGGVSWKAVAINKPSNAKITKVIFTSETTGWLIVQTVEANVVNGKANNFFLLETRDGGKSWRQIIDETGVVVRDFNVVENNIGWIVGIKYLSVEMSRFEVFMMVSTNGGKYWSNISKSLILAIRAEGGQENENISTITYSRDGKILVASTGDKIFQTSDLGNTWTLYETIPKNELDASTIGWKRMGVFAKAGLWISGGKRHYGSSQGVISTNDGNKWLQIKLEGVYFADAILATNDEAFACGLKTQNEKSPRGVILSTVDGGRSWTILFQTSNMTLIKAVQTIDKTTVVSWDANGILYVLTRSV